MLSQVFKIDVTQCIHCAGTLRPIAAIKDPDEIIRYLKHEGINYELPTKAPAKNRRQCLSDLRLGLKKIPKTYILGTPSRGSILLGNPSTFQLANSKILVSLNSQYASYPGRD
jgi:hypothetical protein